MEKPPAQDFQEKPPRDGEALEHLEKLKEKGDDTMVTVCALESLSSERFNRLANFLNREDETMFGFNVLNKEDLLPLINEYGNADKERLIEIEEKIAEMLL